MVEKHEKRNFKVSSNMQDCTSFALEVKLFPLHFKLEVTTVSNVPYYYSLVWGRRDKYASFWLPCIMFIIYKP